MADIVIRKRVSFDFLGDDYAEGYIVFKSISFDENEAIMNQAQAASETEATMEFVKQTLTARFIEGKFPVDGKLADLAADDIGKLNNDAILECFQRIVGGKLDPKV